MTDNIVQLPRLHRTLGAYVPATPRPRWPTRMMREYGLAPGQWVSLGLGLLIGLPLLYAGICAMLLP